MPNIVIDARALCPPEPFLRALAALDRLGSNDELTLLLNRRPHPLFPVLFRYGYRWNEVEVEDGGYEYRIVKG